MNVDIESERISDSVTSAQKSPSNFTLYHGSPDPQLTKINADGLFGGIFASCELQTAQSHGEYIYEIELDDSKIATTFELKYESMSAFAVARKIVNKSYLAKTYDTEDLADAIISDNNDLVSDADDSWELQRLRGQLALKLGYSAVEMEDEHGTSYLCLPTCKIVPYSPAD